MHYTNELQFGHFFQVCMCFSLIFAWAKMFLIIQKHAFEMCPSLVVLVVLYYYYYYLCCYISCCHQLSVFSCESWCAIKLFLCLLIIVSVVIIPYHLFTDIQKIITKLVHSKCARPCVEIVCVADNKKLLQVALSNILLCYLSRKAYNARALGVCKH